MREEASRFENPSKQRPKICPHCRGTNLATDAVRVTKRFPSEFRYVFCSDCNEPVYRFPPVILMAPQNDSWSSANRSPPTNPSGERQS